MAGSRSSSQGADGSILYLQAQTAPGGTAWTRPEALGGFVNGDPAGAANRNSWLEVFVRRPDNTI